MIVRRSSKGFTMIEIMVVVAMIMGLLVMLGPKIAKMFKQQETTKIKFKMIGIKEALQEYKLTFDMFPNTKEGLRALIQNPRPNDERFKRNAAKFPFTEEENLTADSFGNEFVYNCPPEVNKGKYKFFEVLYLGQSNSESDPDYLADGL